MKSFSLVHLLRLAGAAIVPGFPEMPALGHGAGQMLELKRVKVICKPSAFIVFVLLLLVVQPFLVGQVSAQDKTVDAERIERLERLIKAQQQQLESMQKQLNEFKQTAADAKAEAEEAKSVAEAIEKRVDVVSTAKATEVPAPVGKVVTSGGGERVKLAISGQVNRAVNVVDDGKDTDAYFVDNDNSESRVRFDGTAKATDDLTLATRIELTIAPNLAGQVNQNNQSTNNIFDQRWVEGSIDSKRFGKLSLGKGATASYGSAAVDLSRTAVISYATISDTAGGMLFRQTSDDTLTNVKIVDAFNAFDGLNRQNRVRYDSPTFHGFHFATSAISDQRYDAALYWGGARLWLQGRRWRCYR